MYNRKYYSRHFESRSSLHVSNLAALTIALSLAMSRSNTLNLQILVTKLQTIADWFMLGVHLGVPKEELNKIDQQFLSHGVERCKAELFDLWLRRNPSARWDDVVRALERLNEMALASELRELYQVSDPALDLPTSNAPAHDDGEQEAVRVKVSKSTVRQFAKLENKFASLACMQCEDYNRK